MYLVISGQVRVVLDGEGGRSVQIATLGPGSLFGEMSLLSGDRRTASVIANEPVVFERLDKADFAKVICDRPELAEQISLLLSARHAGLAEAHGRLSVTADGRQDLLKRIQAFFGLGTKPGGTPH